jgi:hypothetical protein
MKKLLFLFSAIVFISCSGDDNDYSLVEDNTTNSDSNSTDTGNNSNNLYIIELKKIFKSKQHLFEDIYQYRWGYNNEYGTGYKKHCSLDTLIIDFNIKTNFTSVSDYYVSRGDQFDHPYEYIRYIKVLNYSPNKKIYFDREFLFDKEINCSSGMIFSAWFNGSVANDHDAMGYFDSNLSEEEINSLTDLNSTNNFQPFIKVTPKFENEFRELKMYQQPFDANFPNGLNAGDLITYSTMIENCDGDNGHSSYDSEYEVISISIE